MENKVKLKWWSPKSIYSWYKSRNTKKERKITLKELEESMEFLRDFNDSGKAPRDWIY